MAKRLNYKKAILNPKIFLVSIVESDDGKTYPSFDV
jgi:hypothetical protein